MKVYKISPFWKYFFLIISFSIYFLIGYFAILPLYENPDLHNILAFLIPLVYICSAVFIYIFIVGQSNLVISIDDEKIVQENDNIYKEWFFDEIKGYRITQNSIVLETNNPEKGKLLINGVYDSYTELKSWILVNYKDLDKQDKRIELREIKEFTTEELNLRNAKKTAKRVNIIGGIIGASILFLAKYNYQIPIYASIIFFPICILVLKYYKGLIKIDVNKNSAYPSIAIALIVTSFGLLIRATSDFDLLNFDSLPLIVLIVSMFLITLYLFKEKLNIIFHSKNLLFFGLFVIMCLAYSYGAIVALNCMNDKKTETYTSRILDKRSSGGKTTTYYLTLDKWEKNSKVDETTVNEDFYNDSSKNDIVTITYGSGVFGFSWYYIN